MPVDEKKQPIVIKRIRKVAGGHHGGAWKIAYADFVTAMMAFFLLMWLLGSTSSEDRAAIADYFQNPSAVQGPGGASTSMIKLGGALEVPRGSGEPMHQPAAEELAQQMQEAARLDELMQRIKEQIENTPALAEFKEQLLLDITSEGLRIQIVDREGRPMFDRGSAVLKDYTAEILYELSRTVGDVPNHISITGHTDATAFSGRRPDYTNWELSADRANAARRAMSRGGLGQDKFGRVVGLASSVPFDKENPAAAVNRRISIVVLNRATEQAIGLVDEPTPDEPPDIVPNAPAPPDIAPSLPQPSQQQAPSPAPDDEALEDALSRALEAPE
ncbi:MAG: flagellar motor protein MotB [Pseudomonadota bacterium]